MLNSKRASAEIIGFLLILPLLLMPFFESIQNYIMLNRYDEIKQVTRDAILTAETHGGLSDSDVSAIMQRLKNDGFDVSKIHIDYTPQPIQYGDEVKVRISYTTNTVNFTIDLGGLRCVRKNITMSYGPICSISKYYQRQ